VNDPDGGETTISTTIQSQRHNIESCELIKIPWKRVVATMDGMGHVTETELDLRSDGADIVKYHV